MSAAPSVETTASLAEDFPARRDRLVQMAEQLGAVTDRLGMAGAGGAAQIPELIEALRSERFRVIVLGELKVGKSTLVDAILGADVLPAYDVPTTALPTVIGYAERPQVFLHPRPDAAGEVPSPVEVDLDTFRRWVRIDDTRPGGNPYERAELRWPLGMLRGHVEIMDAPGLNEDDRREAVTMAWLARADAVVMVMTARGGFSLTERGYLDGVVSRLGHLAADTLFFAFNMFDLVRDRDEVVARNTELARSYLGAGAPKGRVFHLSAADALAARTGPDPVPVPTGTGVPELEAALGRFLTEERMRVKIERPAEQLRATISELRPRLPARRAMLDRSREELASAYQAEERRLAELTAEQERITRLVEAWAADTEAGVAERARNFYDDAARRAPDWVAGLERTQRLSLRVWEAKQETEAAVGEIAAGLEARMAAAFAAWRDDTLAGYLTDRAGALHTALAGRVEYYYAEVSGVRARLSTPPAATPRLQAGEVNDTDRLLGVAGGILLPGSSLHGARFGTDGFVRTMVPSVAAWWLGTFILALNPLTIFAGLLAANGFDAFGVRRWAERKLASNAAADYATQLRGESARAAREIAAAVRAHLDAEAARLDRAFGDEIATVRADVGAALATLDKGKAAVEAERLRLEEAEAELNALEAELSNLRTGGPATAAE